MPTIKVCFRDRGSFDGVFGGGNFSSGQFTKSNRSRL